MAPFISLPVPYFNFLSVVVSTALLLWFARAVKRLVRIINVRYAILNDSLVMIRGIGHLLINFEGASQTHINAIIHTRPAKPPSSMNIMYLPYLIKSTELTILQRNNPSLYVKLWCASKSYIMVLSSFKLNFFKQRYHTLKTALNKVLTNILLTTNDNQDDAYFQYVRRNEFTEALVRFGIVDFISPVTVLEAGGNQISIPLLAKQGNRYDIHTGIIYTYICHMLVAYSTILYTYSIVL